MVFLLRVHTLLYERVCIQVQSVLFAETNGAGVTDSASVSFPNYHTCRKKRLFDSFHPSLVSDLFHTAQIFQRHHLRQLWLGWSVGDTERECFTEMKGFRERIGNGKRAVMDGTSLAVRCSLEVNQDVYKKQFFISWWLSSPFFFFLSDGFKSFLNFTNTHTQKES